MAPNDFEFVAAVHNVEMAGRTVQHRMKLTAEVPWSVVITPACTFTKLLTILGKFPIKILPALTPSGERDGTFISVASCVGSSFAEAMADTSFVLLEGLSRQSLTVLTDVAQLVTEFWTSLVAGGAAGERTRGTAALDVEVVAAKLAVPA